MRANNVSNSNFRESLKNIKTHYSVNEKELLEYSRNYGRPLKKPAVLFHPETDLDIQEVVRFSNQHRLPLAIKGFGHSAGLHQEAFNGCLINIRKLREIKGIQELETGEKIIEAQAGASWKEVIDFSIRQKLMPPVYTDWLMLTLGGTLSYGGIGSASFRHGLQTDHVHQLEIITADSQIYVANQSENKDLYDAARAGLGQFGIFTRFQLKLTQAPSHVTLYKIVYTELSDFFHDAQVLMNSNSCDSIIAHFECNRPEVIEKRVGTHHFRSHDKLQELPHLNTRWLGILEVAKYHSLSNGETPILDLNTLKAQHSHIFKDIYSIEEYLNRVPPILDSDLEKKDSEHEECTLFFPYTKESEQLVLSFLADTTHDDIGYGTILFVPMKGSPIHTPFFRKPKTEDFFLLGILRRVSHQSTTSQKKMMTMNHDFYHIAQKELHACRYPCDSIMTTNWKDHYGELWDQYVTLKDRYDPHRIFSPGVGIQTHPQPLIP